MTGDGTAPMLPPDPTPSAETAPAVMDGGAGVPPAPDGEYVPAFRGVHPGGTQAFRAEGVAVDDEEKWCRVSLSVPVGDPAEMVAVDAVAVLDSGSGLTTMTAGIARKLQAAYPRVQIVGGMRHVGQLTLADGYVREVKEKTCPVRIALHTSWGPVTLDKALGIDVYDSLGARARASAKMAGVETAAYQQCRRVSLSVDALQQVDAREEQPDEAVERLAERGPDIGMSPEEEEMKLQVSGHPTSSAFAALSAIIGTLSGEDCVRGIRLQRWNR